MREYSSIRMHTYAEAIDLLHAIIFVFSAYSTHKHIHAHAHAQANIHAHAHTHKQTHMHMHTYMKIHA